MTRTLLIIGCSLAVFLAMVVVAEISEKDFNKAIDQMENCTEKMLTKILPCVREVEHRLHKLNPNHRPSEEQMSCCADSLYYQCMLRELKPVCVGEAKSLFEDFEKNYRPNCTVVPAKMTIDDY